jgi:mono/diheme cytochrome c family protein
VQRLVPLVWVLFLLYGCTFGPGGNVEVVRPEAASPAEGGQIYRDACAACHGSSGRGDGPVAPALKVAPTNLTRLSEGNGGIFPRELIVATIEGENAIASHGAREMPVWSSRFTPTGYGATAVAAIHARRQVEALAAYIESLQLPQAPAD